MFHLVRADSADNAWLKALELFHNQNLVRHQKSRDGDTLEISNVCIEISNPMDRWIVSRIPAINPAFALAEVIWIIQGRNDLDFLKFYNSRMQKYSDDGLSMHGAYGYRLRNEFGFDQLEDAYNAFRNNPDTRQVVLQFWNPSSDFPNLDGSARSKDIPCNIISLLKIREGRLEWTQIMRSNDMYTGFPYNVVQFTSMQEVLAGWLGVEVGTYHHYADSLHFYLRDNDCLSSTKRSVSMNNCASLYSPKDVSNQDFKTLEQLAIQIATSAPDLSESTRMLQSTNLSDGMRDILCILLSEGLRRKHAVDCPNELLGLCGNSAYVDLWSSWSNHLAALRT